MKRLEKLKANNCLLEDKNKTPEEIVPFQISIFQSGRQNRLDSRLFWTKTREGKK